LRWPIPHLSRPAITSSHIIHAMLIATTHWRSVATAAAGTIPCISLELRVAQGRLAPSRPIVAIAVKRQQSLQLMPCLMPYSKSMRPPESFAPAPLLLLYTCTDTPASIRPSVDPCSRLQHPSVTVILCMHAGKR
jgi:hypothetical protein